VRSTRTDEYEDEAPRRYRADDYEDEADLDLPIGAVASKARAREIDRVSSVVVRPTSRPIERPQEDEWGSPQRSNDDWDVSDG